MIRKKWKLSIRDALKHRDIYLFDKLEKIWNESFNKLTVDSENLALNHSISVEQNISALIPDEWKLDKLYPLELFSLSAAACLHDIDKHWGVTKKLHGEISSGEIRAHFANYGLDAGQADIVSWIIKVHDHGDFDFDLPKDTIAVGIMDINIKQLAALFKLADILHTDYLRVDQERPTSPKERARYCIRGWKYDVDGRIKFYAEPEQISDLEHIHKAIAMIRQEIEKIAPILKKYDYPNEIAVAEIDESKLVYSIQIDKFCNRSFLGMEPFCEDDQHLFKGRERETQELYQMLLANDPIVTLVGESGIGKTSLIRAGLFPTLRKAGWKFAYIKVINNDINGTIQRMWFQIMENNIPNNIDFIESLRVISEYNRNYNNLILIDQFENALFFNNFLEQIKNALYHIQSMRFRNIRVLLCYRTDFEEQIKPILQDIAYSMRSIPKFYVNDFDMQNAKKALLAGMDTVCIGFDPNIGSDNFVEIILKDIEKRGKGFYPPYIQMVGETLTNKALNEQNGIIQKTLYDSLNGASGIIEDYLFKQLESFGNERKDAENILIALTSFFDYEQPKPKTRSIKELEIELRLETDYIREILYKMSCKRIINHCGSDSYKLIDDKLAKKINDKLMATKQGLEFRELCESLYTIAKIYSKMNIILDPLIMSKIYQNREKINPNIDEKVILLHSCIAQQGPAWFWFKNSNSNEYIPVLYSGLLHSSISLNVVKLLGFIKEEEVVDKLVGLIGNTDKITCSVIESLGKIGFKKAIPILIDNLDNPSIFVCAESIKALSKLGAIEAIPKIVDIINLGETNIQKIALEAYSKLANQADIPLFIELLASKVINEKLVAIKTLARLIRKQFIPELYRMFRDKNRYIRIASIEAMTDIAKEENNFFSDNLPFISTIKSSLYQMLQDRSREVRISVCKAFTQLSSYEDISELNLMLKSDVIDIRVESLKALVRLGFVENIITIREIFRNNLEQKQIALDALINLGDRGIILELIDMIKDKDPVIRKMAVKGLCALGFETEISVLLDMIISTPDNNLYARDALIGVDQRLYCPFNCN